MLHKRLFLLILVGVLLFAVMPTLAQDVTVEPTLITPTSTPIVLNPDPPIITEPEPGIIAPVDLRDIVEVLRIAFTETVFKGVQGAGLVVLITVVVGVIKYIPPIRKGIEAGTISLNLIVLGVTIVVWLVAGTATWFGFTTQFQGAVAWIVDVLPKSLQFLGLIVGAPWLHELASLLKVPIIGKKLTPEFPSPVELTGMTSWAAEPGTSMASHTWHPGRNADLFVTHDYLQQYSPILAEQVADALYRKQQDASLG